MPIPNMRGPHTHNGTEAYHKIRENEIEKGRNGMYGINPIISDLNDKYCPFWVFCIRVGVQLIFGTSTFVAYLKGWNNITAVSIYITFAILVVGNIVSVITEKRMRLHDGPIRLSQNSLNERCGCSYVCRGLSGLILCEFLYAFSIIPDVGAAFCLWFCKIEPFRPLV